MKLTTLLLLIALLHVSAKVFSQVSVSVANTPAETVMKAIEKQTGYVFIYDEAKVKLGMVNVDLHNASIAETLNQLLKNLPVTYQIIKKNIVLQAKTETASRQENKAAANQPISVSGKVLDELNKPLPGVSVREKGTNNGVVTDQNGLFSLQVVNGTTIIIFSSIGFETQEFRAKDLSNPALVVLKASSTNLKEVVISKGYYNTTQELNTGDVSNVTSKEIEQQPVSNLMEALEGRVTGLFVSQGNGVPGGRVNIQLRGQNSIANGNDPLYLVDGVPYSSELMSTVGTTIINQPSPFNYLNPSDIENIEVLKDADATAIYGSRGANGVILITTKKGKQGKTKIDLNAYSGVGTVTRNIDWMNTQQYLEMRREALKNDGATPSLANGDYDLLTYDTTRYTNWQKELIGGTAHYSDVNGSISGGNETTQYLIGGAYHKETTVYPGDFNDKKGSVHFNITTASTDQKLKVILSGSYMVDNNYLPSYDLTSLIPELVPDAPPAYNADGTLNWADGTFNNPYAVLLQKFLNTTNNLVSSGTVSYQILPNLEFKTALGYTNNHVSENSTYPITSNNPYYNITTGSAGFTDNNISSWSIEPQINYHTKLLGGKLSSLIGTSFQQSVSTGQILYGSGYTSDALLENIQGASSITATYIDNHYKYSAIFGQINYNLQDKYLINVTGRRDGSSRFGPGRQFADFGAIGAGWIFSKESFIEKNFSLLSFGKLRVSYGTSGNDQIGDYQYLSKYNLTSYAYQGSIGLYPGNLYNPDYSWEINKKLEGGLELGFLENMISLNVSYFRNRSSNQLVGYPLPSITGFTSVTANSPATVQNTGLELTASANLIKNENFKWTSSVNLTIPRNKLIAYPNLASSPYAYQYVIGQPITIAKVYHLIGVNDTTGLYQFENSKGQPTYNPNPTTDRNTIINLEPKFYGGFENSFQYKGFQLDFLFQFVKQTGPVVAVGDILPGYFGGGYYGGSNEPVDILNRWQKIGDVAKFQKFTQADFNVLTGYENAQESDFNYGDASYIRLKNLSLSYQLPIEWIKKLNISSCRIYIHCQDLLTFTNYIGSDPETQAERALPPLKVITLGTQITF